MNTQVPPDLQLSRQENELICERLLGWKPERRTVAGLVHVAWWDRGPGRSDTETTPSFTTWAEAGLILDEFNRRKVEVDINMEDGQCWVTLWIPKPRSPQKSEKLPPLVRAAALIYIRSLP